MWDRYLLVYGWDQSLSVYGWACLLLLERVGAGFSMYTTGLAFSSLKEWELAFLLYTSGTAISLYTGPIAPLI